MVRDRASTEPQRECARDKLSPEASLATRVVSLTCVASSMSPRFGGRAELRSATSAPATFGEDGTTIRVGDVPELESRCATARWRALGDREASCRRALRPRAGPRAAELVRLSPSSRPRVLRPHSCSMAGRTGPREDLAERSTHRDRSRKAPLPAAPSFVDYALERTRARERACGSSSSARRARPRSADRSRAPAGRSTRASREITCYRRGARG